MNTSWSIRGIAIVCAIIATIIVFWLWATFGKEVMMAMDASTQQANPSTASDGAYVVNVLPPPKDCPKEKPCPK